MTIFHLVGTDTNVGKTHSGVQIMHHLIRDGYRVAGLKPLSCGISATELGLMNEDAAQLMTASNYPLSVAQVNPFSLKSAIAPHIAAQLEGRRLSGADIVTKLNATTSQINADYTLIEGVGGIMVPLNSHETYLDILSYLPHPLILVVGMKLGCLNHALLSAAALRSRGIKLSAWIANQVDPQMANYSENCTYLQDQLNPPLIATIPYRQKLQITPFFKEVFQCL